VALPVGLADPPVGDSGAFGDLPDHRRREVARGGQRDAVADDVEKGAARSCGLSLWSLGDSNP
jgi:hypothetical protein